MAQPDIVKETREQFAGIANDLMNIEVNIILKEDIPVQKMPDPRHALIDIGKMYAKKLRALSYLAEPCATAEEPEREEEWQRENWEGSFDAFDGLRNWANEILDCLSERGDLTSQEKTDLSLLSRIKDNSDQIKGIFTSLILREANSPDSSLSISISYAEIGNPNEVVEQIPDEHERKRYLTNRFSRAQLVIVQSDEENYPPLDLTPDEVVLLRKIWEIGVEIVAMQTVIQIDGDVMTRVHPAYLSNSYELLHEYHNQGVGIALSYWKDLVNVARELITTLVQVLTGQSISGGGS